MRVLDVGSADVRIVHRPAEPLLIPPKFVHAIVVATAIGHGDFVKIIIVEQRAHRILSASRTAVNSHARQIHPRPRFRRRLNPRDAIRKTRVLQIFPTHIVKLFAPIVRAHAVRLHNYETEFRERVLTQQPTKTFRRKRILRPGINFLDDRIFFLRIKIGRFDDDAVNVRRAIATFRHKAFRHRPTGFQQARSIRSFEFAD